MGACARVRVCACVLATEGCFVPLAPLRLRMALALFAQAALPNAPCARARDCHVTEPPFTLWVRTTEVLLLSRRSATSHPRFGFGKATAAYPLRLLASTQSGCVATGQRRHVPISVGGRLFALPRKNVLPLVQ